MTPARKDVAMKKTCSVLLCVLLLSLAPTTFAADGARIGAIGQLVDQLISFFSGIGEALAGEESVTGEEFPPEAGPSAAAEPESGIFFPPGG